MTGKSITVDRSKDDGSCWWQKKIVIAYVRLTGYRKDCYCLCTVDWLQKRWLLLMYGWLVTEKRLLLLIYGWLVTEKIVIADVWLIGDRRDCYCLCTVDWLQKRLLLLMYGWLVTEKIVIADVWLTGDRKDYGSYCWRLIRVSVLYIVLVTGRILIIDCTGDKKDYCGREFFCLFTVLVTANSIITDRADDRKTI